MTKPKHQRGERSTSVRVVSRAPDSGGLGWPLILVWGWLGVYGVLYFLSTLTTGPVGAEGPLKRWQLLSPLLLPDEIVTRWCEGCTWHSLGQRATILGLAATIFLVAVAAGSICLELGGLSRRLTRLESFVFSAGVGLNLVSLATLALGLAGGLRFEIFVSAGVTIALVAGALAWRGRRRDGSRPIENETTHGLRLSPAWLWLGMPFVLAILFGAMLPPLDFDVREYHLEAPKEFYQSGRITFLPYNVYANMPLGTEMLSLAAMVVARDWWIGGLVGKTLIGGFAPLAALALLAAGRRFFTPAAGVVAALVYISIPWVALVSTQGLVEGGFAFYLMLALMGVMGWRANLLSGEASVLPLALAGFMAGAAASCKYPAIVFCVLPLGVWVGILGWKVQRVGLAVAVAERGDGGGGRRGPHPNPLPKGEGTVGWAVGVFLVFAALGCGLWFVKNGVLTGNPTYPLLANVFATSERTPEAIARFARVHGVPNFELSDLAGRIADVVLRSDWLSPIVVPLAVLAVVIPSRQRRLAWILAGYFGFVILAWWLLTHRIDRFWIPALPVLALLAGIGATWSDSRWWRATLAAVGAVGLAFSLVVVAGGELDDNRYLADLDELRVDPARVDPWHVYLNEKADEVTRVLLVGDAQPFDLNVPVVYNTVFDNNIFERMARGRTPEQIRAALAEQNISHIYVAWGEIRRYRSTGNYGMSDFIRPAQFERLLSAGVLELLPPIENNGDQLFRVLPLRPDRR